MRRLISTVLVALTLSGLAACGNESFPTPTPAPTITATAVPRPSPSPTNPFAGRKLYLNPDTQIAAWVANHPEAPQSLKNLAKTAHAKWLTDDESTTNDLPNWIEEAKRSGDLPVVVIYNIPYRDCGSYSGNSTEADQYQIWLKGVINTLKSYRSVVILEPDALPQLDDSECKMTPAQKAERIGLLRQAVTDLATAQQYTYIDAGNGDGADGNWQPPEVIAQRLIEVGVQYASGYSLNTSNFIETPATTKYAKQISALIPGHPGAVVDTSRNGNGVWNGIWKGKKATNTWCNPPGRKIGHKPEIKSSGPLHALLWVKAPGESDGKCRQGDRPPGELSIAQALALAA